MRDKVLMTALLAAALINVAYARQHGQHKTQGHGHDAHTQGVNKRGNRVMGFDQQKTTHHFLLYQDGGAIEVTANDASDTQSREQIRKHLRDIARLFAEGNFNAPLLIHARTPPGVPAMRRLKSAIKYDFEESERGARIRIRTSHPKALPAVHQFLRFQIKDHQTGDSTEVKREGR